MLLWFILIVLLFLSAFSNAMCVSSALVTLFFKGRFTFKIWVFLIYIQNFSDFLDRSVSELCKIIICVVIVCIFLT